MGSSGGGSSGAVSHSPYLETCHGDWLNATGVDVISKSITEVMDSAIGNSPWIGLAAYNPDADILAYENALVAFQAILAGLSETVDWAALYAQAEAILVGPGEVALLADAAAFAAIIDDNINTVTLPRFRRGMQDINAVVSSAFVIGEAIIESFRDRDVAKYLSTVRIGMLDKKISATEQMMQMMARRVAWQESYVKMIVESKRIKLVAKKEQTDQDATIDEADAKWDLEVFQYGANVMAASAGGTSTSGVKGISKAASVLGGAMMGAAAGAMVGAEIGSVGGPYGAAIGAVLGAAVAMLS